ncbi:MAG TPA: secondary thiamine-phosphate synthase enzyme YjbQ [Longimicrobium sp.]|nr:secondary thiamine-phosphate synthase enzyme YjbQ [Longimicrobium sp.]
MERIRVATRERNALVEITAQVDGVVRRSGVREGMVVVQSLHTTAALTVNENADPDVVHDVLGKMEELVPATEPYYQHAEGNSDSHVKTSLFGPSLTLIVSEGRPLLGRWQGIYLCEWDGPRERTVAVQVMASGSDEEPRIVPDMHAPR